MKKVLFVLALGAFAACGTTENKDVKTDSTTVTVDSTVVKVDSTVVTVDTTKVDSTKK